MPAVITRIDAERTGQWSMRSALVIMRREIASKGITATITPHWAGEWHGSEWNETKQRHFIAVARVRDGRKMMMTLVGAPTAAGARTPTATTRISASDAVANSTGGQQMSTITITVGDETVECEEHEAAKTIRRIKREQKKAAEEKSRCFRQASTNATLNFAVLINMLCDAREVGAAPRGWMMANASSPGFRGREWADAVKYNAPGTKVTGYSGTGYASHTFHIDRVAALLWSGSGRIVAIMLVDREHRAYWHCVGMYQGEFATVPIPKEIGMWINEFADQLLAEESADAA